MKSFFIDTNIFIYAQGVDHKYKKPSQNIMHLVASDKIYGATNVEVLQEILYRYACIGKKSLGIQMVENILAIVHEVIPVVKSDIKLSMNLMHKYREINVRDAIHAATVLRNNFHNILSVDKHFDKIKEIKRIDPFSF